jgi:hypothetical protein
MAQQAGHGTCNHAAQMLACAIPESETSQAHAAGYHAMHVAPRCDQLGRDTGTVLPADAQHSTHPSCSKDSTPARNCLRANSS